MLLANYMDENIVEFITVNSTFAAKVEMKVPKLALSFSFLSKKLRNLLFHSDAKLLFLQNHCANNFTFKTSFELSITFTFAKKIKIQVTNWSR